MRQVRLTRRLIIGGLATLGLGVGAAALRRLWWTRRGEGALPSRGTLSPQLTAYEDLMGCRYTAASQTPLEAVTVRSIPVPEFPGRWAIWGATGRDSTGHIWIGVSANNVRQSSARLFEYDPIADVLHARGDVIGELRRSGHRVQPKEGQMKIHSRIVQAEDGHLYFASMDEDGEMPDGSRLPQWGSHFWRMRLPERRWEHLFSAPEGLVAVAGSGQWILALGYFNHVLYQYDCRTGTTRSLSVGSVGGHVSRNFFCDIHGHIYVPRLREGPEGLRTTLVELDPQLREVTETPIGHYTQTRDDDSHGIVSFQPLADQSIVFATDQGFLYRVVPQQGQNAEVQELGWFHPNGQAYVASMFTSDGRQHLLGLTVRESAGSQQFDWLVYDISKRSCMAVPVELPAIEGQIATNVALYGSITRDDAGRCYVAGLGMVEGRPCPLFLQIQRQG